MLNLIKKIKERIRREKEEEKEVRLKYKEMPKEEAYKKVKKGLLSFKKTLKERNTRIYIRNAYIYKTLSRYTLLLMLVVFLNFRPALNYGPSNMPTINEYDISLSFSLSKTENKLDYLERGDFIVLNSEKVEATYGVSNVSKRIIGLPGDTIYIDCEKAVVYVNGELDKMSELFYTADTGEYVYNFHATRIKEGKFSTENNPYTLKEGEVFVLGDNRLNSLDSREFGPITAEEIDGVQVANIEIGNYIKRIERRIVNYKRKRNPSPINVVN